MFRDIDVIGPGEKFIDAIERSLSSCKVLIVVIGEGWLTIKDENGGRRLDNPEDVLRLEIVTALKLNIDIIPVLVQGATMPRPQDLPEVLRPLTQWQAIEVSDSRWPYDVGRLVTKLKELLPRQIFSWQKFGIAIICIGGLVLGVWLIPRMIPTNNGSHSQGNSPLNSNTPVKNPESVNSPPKTNGPTATSKIEAVKLTIETTDEKNTGEIVYVRIHHEGMRNEISKFASASEAWPVDPNNRKEIPMLLNPAVPLAECEKLKLEISKPSYRAWEFNLDVDVIVGGIPVRLPLDTRKFDIEKGNDKPKSAIIRFNCSQLRSLIVLRN